MNVPGLDRWWTGRLTIKTEEMVFLYHSSILKHILWKESWNKDGQWFNQNQQSERPPLISNHWTHKKNLAYGIGNPSYGMEQAQKCGRIKPVEGISTHIKSATDICHDYFTLKFLQWRISFGYLLLFSFFFWCNWSKVPCELLSSLCFCWCHGGIFICEVETNCNIVSFANLIISCDFGAYTNFKMSTTTNNEISLIGPQLTIVQSTWCFKFNIVDSVVVLFVLIGNPK